MAIAEELETKSVSIEKLKSGRSFSGSNTGKNVTDTVSVIGVLFIAWCVSAVLLLWHLW